MSRRRGRPSYQKRRLGPDFQTRKIALAPGDERTYDEAEWRDALVVVELGSIELEGRAGGRRMFKSGDVLYLAGVPLRLLRNRGPLPAVISATSRRKP
jgi:hypothetical protein